jgi:hypothetical protein
MSMAGGSGRTEPQADRLVHHPPAMHAFDSLRAEPFEPGHSASTPACAVPARPVAVRGEEDWSFAGLTDSQVDGPRGVLRERDGDDLAAFARDRS